MVIFKCFFYTFAELCLEKVYDSIRTITLSLIVRRTPSSCQIKILLVFIFWFSNKIQEANKWLLKAKNAILRKENRP